MKKINILFFLFQLLFHVYSYAQNTLPAISVNNLNGKIIVSWLNDYEKPVSNILIQRSYDSLRNFKTIGTVLNPTNKENGYPDNNPPYSKMYYRVSVLFEGGSYEIGPSATPFREAPPLPPFIKIEEPIIVMPPSIPIVEKKKDTVAIIKKDPIAIIKKDTIASLEREEKVIVNKPETIEQIDSLKRTDIEDQQKITNHPFIINKSIDSSMVLRLRNSVETNYPSNRVFTGKQNSLIIHLPAALFKRYDIKFFNEESAPIFEIKNIKEDYLIIEKENFVHSGWFYFEIYEDGKLIEKNKFLIPKEIKNNK